MVSVGNGEVMCSCSLLNLIAGVMGSNKNEDVAFQRLSNSTYNVPANDLKQEIAYLFYDHYPSLAFRF